MMTVIGIILSFACFGLIVWIIVLLFRARDVEIIRP